MNPGVTTMYQDQENERGGGSLNGYQDVAERLREIGEISREIIEQNESIGELDVSVDETLTDKKNQVQGVFHDVLHDEQLDTFRQLLGAEKSFYDESDMPQKLHQEANEIDNKIHENIIRITEIDNTAGEVPPVLSEIIDKAMSHIHKEATLEKLREEIDSLDLSDRAKLELEKQLLEQEQGELGSKLEELNELASRMSAPIPKLLSIDEINAAYKEIYGSQAPSYAQDEIPIGKRITGGAGSNGSREFKGKESEASRKFAECVAAFMNDPDHPQYLDGAEIAYLTRSSENIRSSDEKMATLTNMLWNNNYGNSRSATGISDWLTENMPGYVMQRGQRTFFDEDGKRFKQGSEHTPVFIYRIIPVDQVNGGEYIIQRWKITEDGKYALNGTAEDSNWETGRPDIPTTVGNRAVSDVVLLPTGVNEAVIPNNEEGTPVAGDY